MLKGAIVFWLLPVFGNCVVYIDRVKSDFNSKIGNLSVAYKHNNKGDCVVNLTLESYVYVTKFLLYGSIRLPESKIDREYRVEIIRTVVDVEKLSKGLQSNLMIRGYVDNVMKFMDFKIEFPFKPVSSNE